MLIAFGSSYEALANLFGVSVLTAHGWGQNQPMPPEVLAWVDGVEWALRLEAVRVAFNWTYTNLAKILQVSVSSVHGWCHYTYPMPASVKGWVQGWEQVIQEQNRAKQLEFAGKLLKETIIGGAFLLAGYLLGRGSSSNGNGNGNEADGNH